MQEKGEGLARSGRSGSRSAPAAGPYLRKAPIILEKPDVVYVAENQPASITITLNHVHAVVTWKRSVPAPRAEVGRR